jgi:glutaredoxin 2
MGNLMEYEAAEDAAATAAVHAKLAELPYMMHGDKSLNKWGFGMDDFLLLPWLRRLTCIKGVAFPKKVHQYMPIVGRQLEHYSKHAIERQEWEWQPN